MGLVIWLFAMLDVIKAARCCWWDSWPCSH